MTTKETLDSLMDLLKDLPDGTDFEVVACGWNPSNKVRFQCRDRAKFARLRGGFPGVIWKKEWVRDLKWWDFSAESKGWKLLAYACCENPPVCKAITEKKKVTVKTPTAWEEHEEERDVIIGWDCKEREEA